MTYIYDLILNFNCNFLSFYEWEKSDEYYHIKRINLLKVNPKTFNDIIDYKVTFNDEVFINIFNKCEYFDRKQVKNFPYTFLLTDGYRTIAISLNNDMKIDKYSCLLLDEEEEVLEISERLPVIKLAYDINEKNEVCNLTREEFKIINYIRKDLERSYLKKDIAKLRYLYYEYFNEKSEDLEKIYKSLLKSLNKFDDKHHNLYHLIKLSYNKELSR